MPSNGAGLGEPAAVAQLDKATYRPAEAFQPASSCSLPVVDRAAAEPENISPNSRAPPVKESRAARTPEAAEAKPPIATRSSRRSLGGHRRGASDLAVTASVGPHVVPLDDGSLKVALALQMKEKQERRRQAAAAEKEAEERDEARVRRERAQLAAEYAAEQASVQAKTLGAVAQVRNLGVA